VEWSTSSGESAARGLVQVNTARILSFLLLPSKASAHGKASTVLVLLSMLAVAVAYNDVLADPTVSQ
jgi:hypothetical protein